ncbi:MAG: hypothetical protein H0U90_05150 [Actinobacteria bacterium]|nr:hypothetical protein [Actinomycetota bacterium]
MRNASSVLALVLALLALAALGSAGFAARELPEISWLEAGAVIPFVGLLALFALSLASRGRAQHQRTLGRAGGEGVARTARGLGLLALLLTLTAALALAVFAVLATTDGLTKTPW